MKIKNIITITAGLVLSLSLAACSESAMNDLGNIGSQYIDRVESTVSDVLNDWSEENGDDNRYDGNGSASETETTQNGSIPADLEALIQSVTVAPADENAQYDRDLYTSSSQYYECEDPEHDWHNSNGYTGDDDGEYTSVRAYGFYESKYYDGESDSYTDPYTNETSDVSESGPKGYDWDHVIPLAYADSHGTNAWTEEQKKAFADDPLVGVCVNASDNRAKGAKGPSEWLPDENVDDYCYTWLVISSEYGLSISQEDMDTILQYVNEDSLSMVG